MLKNIKQLKFIDWILIIMIIFIPMVLITTIFKNLDNDIWYLLSEGRYILQNGLYHIDVLSMHEGLDIVVQNWLSAVIFWIVYAFTGDYGIFFMVMITNCIILYLLYKLCMLISDDNKGLSIITTIFTDLSLCLFFIVSRPQIFSFVIILLLLYLLELYIKHDDTKYLKFIPLLSFLEINLHASIWWYIFLFMIPYIIDSFKNKKLMLQGYRKKPLFITFIISLLVGFINPYGYKAITFIFNSYGDKYMLNNILELQPFNLNNLTGILTFVVILVTMFCYVYFRSGKIRVRYLCLYCGTLIIGMKSIKGLNLFMLVASFPIALLLKDIFPREFKKHQIIKTRILYALIILITIGSVGYTGYRYIKIKDRIKLNHMGSKAMNTLNLFANNRITNVFVSFNDGGFVEFSGHKPYIDPRAEVFLKKNNHKEDIYKEYCEFEAGQIDINEFLKKYNFDFLFLRFGERLYNEDKIDNYFVIYDDISTGYKVYARNDITSDEIRKMVIKEYEKSKQEKIKEQ